MGTEHPRADNTHPPSPEYPAEEFPPIVNIVPVERFTSRITLLPKALPLLKVDATKPSITHAHLFVSAIHTPPGPTPEVLSKDTPLGVLRFARVAGLSDRSARRMGRRTGMRWPSALTQSHRANPRFRFLQPGPQSHSQTRDGSGCSRGQRERPRRARRPRASPRR